MWQRLLANRPLQVTLALAALYLLGLLAIDTGELKRLLDGARIGFAASAFFICASRGWQAFMRGSFDNVDQFSFGMTTVWGVVLLQAVYVPLSRADEPPGWFLWLDNRLQIPSLLPFLFIIAAAFFLIPIGNRSATVPFRSMWFMIGASALGGAAAAAAVILGLKNALGF
jgi:hypothetical protein